jgi:hypothetical protein
MTEALTQSNFVRPYFIEELGEEGLTAADIAKSLGTEAKNIRKKLTSREFITRIEAQGFKVAIVTLKNINGVQYDESVLDTSAAKFFVGKYDSPQGDSYLAFLIRLERKVNELDEMTRSDPLLQQIAATQRLRVRQLQQEMRIEALEGRVDTVDDRLLDSILSVPQKRALKGLIDSRAIALGGAYLAGAIQKDLKSKFGLNATNDKWYHLRQGDFEEARDFVSNWGSDSFWENWG